MSKQDVCMNSWLNFHPEVTAALSVEMAVTGAITRGWGRIAEGRIAIGTIRDAILLQRGSTKEGAEPYAFVDSGKWPSGKEGNSNTVTGKIGEGHS